jgi:hypothetical protein
MYVGETAVPENAFSSWVPFCFGPALYPPVLTAMVTNAIFVAVWVSCGECLFPNGHCPFLILRMNECDPVVVILDANSRELDPLLIEIIS